MRTGHAGTKRKATKTAKSVFLVSALVWLRSCGCHCTSSTTVARRVRGSARARRFSTVGEREEKKILKSTNDESGCHCTRPKANLMMREAVHHKVRRVLPNWTERANRSTENAEEKEKTKQKGVLFFFKNTINQGAHTKNIKKTERGHKRMMAKKRKNEKTEKRAAGQREHKNAGTSKVVP